MQKLTAFLTGVCVCLLCLLVTIQTHKKEQPGVVYLQDYDCSMKLSHAKEECEAWALLLHRIWIDNPSYVEDVLTEYNEFVRLDSLSDFGNVFEFWSVEDSVNYHTNIETQEIEAKLFLKYYREPDTIPSQPKN